MPLSFMSRVHLLRPLPLSLFVRINVFCDVKFGSLNCNGAHVFI